MGTWYDTHPATGEAVMTPGFKEKYQSFGRDELNPRTVYDSYEFKDTGNPFKEEVWQRPRSYDSTQQARTYSPGQTRMSGRTSTQKPGLLTKGLKSVGSGIDDFIGGLYDRDKILDLEIKHGVGATGLPSDARHMAAMNELSKTIATPISKISEPLGTFVGDTGAFAAGLINEIPGVYRSIKGEAPIKDV